MMCLCESVVYATMFTDWSVPCDRWQQLGNAPVKPLTPQIESVLLVVCRMEQCAVHSCCWPKIGR